MIRETKDFCNEAIVAIDFWRRGIIKKPQGVKKILLNLVERIQEDEAEKRNNKNGS